jgi:hypothetical protein
MGESNGMLREATAMTVLIKDQFGVECVAGVRTSVGTPDDLVSSWAVILMCVGWFGSECMHRVCVCRFFSFPGLLGRPG